jgi:hypothetical protein
MPAGGIVSRSCCQNPALDDKDILSVVVEVLVAVPSEKSDVLVLVTVIGGDTPEYVYTKPVVAVEIFPLVSFVCKRR